MQLCFFWNVENPSIRVVIEWMLRKKQFGSFWQILCMLSGGQNVVGCRGKVLFISVFQFWGQNVVGWRGKVYHCQEEDRMVWLLEDLPVVVLDSTWKHYSRFSWPICPCLMLSSMDCLLSMPIGILGSLLDVMLTSYSSS